MPTFVSVAYMYVLIKVPAQVCTSATCASKTFPKPNKFSLSVSVNAWFVVQ